MTPELSDQLAELNTRVTGAEKASLEVDRFQEKLGSATSFWSEVAKQIPAWQQAIAGQASPAELRKQFVHAHGIALAALGRVGQSLLIGSAKDWRPKLRGLKTLDWSRANSTAVQLHPSTELYYLFSVPP